MIDERASRLSRRTLTFSLALSAFFPMLCAGTNQRHCSSRLSATPIRARHPTIRA